MQVQILSKLYFIIPFIQISKIIMLGRDCKKPFLMLSREKKIKSYSFGNIKTNHHQNQEKEG